MKPSGVKFEILQNCINYTSILGIQVVQLSMVWALCQGKSFNTQVTQLGQGNHNRPTNFTEYDNFWDIIYIINFYQFSLNFINYIIIIIIKDIYAAHWLHPKCSVNCLSLPQLLDMLNFLWPRTR